MDVSHEQNLRLTFRFKSLLTSSGPAGGPRKEIEISDVKYNIFQVVFGSPAAQLKVFTAAAAALIHEGVKPWTSFFRSSLVPPQIMMSYLYCGGTESLKTNVPDLLEVRTTSCTYYFASSFYDFFFFFTF